MWVGTDDAGVDVLDPATGEIRHFRHDPADPASIGDDTVLALLEDSRGTIWAGTGEGGLNRHRWGDDGWDRFTFDPDDPGSLSDDRVWAIAEDSTGNLWVGTSFGGLNLFDPATGRAIAYRHDVHIPTSLSDDRVYALHEDRSGQLWVGSASGGLNRAVQVPFRQIYQRGSGERAVSSLADGNVRTVLEDRTGALWVGTYRGGLERIDRESGRVTSFRHDPGNPSSLSHDRVWSIAEAADGRLWVGTPRGLDLFDPATGQVRRYEPQPGLDHSAHNDVNVVLAHSRGDLFLGTWGWGLVRFDPRTGATDLVQAAPGRDDSLADDHIFQIVEGSDGTVWVGTRDGLSAVDPVTLAVRSWRHDPDDPASLGYPQVSAVLEAGDGTLWLGTWGGWISTLARDQRWPAGSRFERLDDSDGLMDNTIAGLVEDGRGAIWASTSDGLYRFDPERRRFETFGPRDGLTARRFNPKAAIRRRDGTLVFGGFYGLVLHRALPDPVLPPPELVVTSVRADGVELMRPTGADADAVLEIEHDVRVLTVEFAALDLRPAELHHYRTRLSGYDRDWVDVGARRSVVYSGLPAGRYRFSVRASVDRGEPAELTPLELRVAAAPWLRWWALAGYGVLAAGAMLGAHRLRLAALRRRARRLEETVERRTAELSLANRELAEANRFKSEFFAIAAHDLRGPLQGIVGSADLVRASSPSADAGRHAGRILEAAQRMTGLLDQLFELSRIDSGGVTLDPQTFDLGELAEIAARNAQHAAGRKAQRIEVGGTDPCPVRADRGSVQRVVDNLVDNAVKFSPPASAIRLETTCGNGRCELRVRDWGPGFTDDDLGRAFGRFQRLSARPTGGEASTGLGLAICRELMTLNGGAVRIVNGPGRGATLIVELPAVRR